jgi:hypothetical protein
VSGDLQLGLGGGVSPKTPRASRRKPLPYKERWGEILGHARKVLHLGLKDERDMRETASVVKNWLLAGRKPDDIMAAMTGVRWLVDDGQVGFLKPKRPITARAMNHVRAWTQEGSERDLYTWGRERVYQGRDASKAQTQFGNITITIK